MLATVIATSTYSPKSKAGIALLATSGALCISTRCAGHSMGFLYWVGLGAPAAALGVAGTIPGVILLATGNIPAGVVLLVLDENGIAGQDEIERALAEKYSFISDREAIFNLAEKVKSKSDLVNFDEQGKKIISLTAEEVSSALAATEITQDELKQIVSDFK